MKITQHTEEELIIKIPNLTLFIGSVFMLVGLVTSIATSIAPELPVIFPIMLFTILCGVGLVMVLFGKTYLITLNSSAKTITYTKKNFIKHDTNLYSFQDVEKVETRTFRGTHNNRVTVLQSFLVLKNADRLMLDYQHGPRASVQKSELESAQLVANFVGVNFSSDRKALDDTEIDSVNI